MATTAPAATLNYDAEADVLYIALGDAREAIGLEPEEGIVLRLDPETDQLVGVTVIGLRERLRRQPDWRPAPFEPESAVWEQARRVAVG